MCIGRSVNEVVEKRKAVSGNKFLHLVVDVGVPGEEGGLIKRIRRRFESKVFITMRSSYTSTREFGGEDDNYSGERSRWATIIMSGRVGNRKPNSLSR